MTEPSSASNLPLFLSVPQFPHLCRARGLNLIVFEVLHSPIG